MSLSKEAKPKPKGKNIANLLFEKRARSRQARNISAPNPRLQERTRSRQGANIATEYREVLSEIRQTGRILASLGRRVAESNIVTDGDLAVASTSTATYPPNDLAPEEVYAEYLETEERMLQLNKMLESLRLTVKDTRASGLKVSGRNPDPVSLEAATVPENNHNGRGNKNIRDDKQDDQQDMKAKRIRIMETDNIAQSDDDLIFKKPSVPVARSIKKINHMDEDVN